MQSESTIKDALKRYQKSVNTERTKIIDVDRSKLWKTALVFYKSTPKDHLGRKLNVMFEGFKSAVSDLIREVNLNIFEGQED